MTRSGSESTKDATVVSGSVESLFAEVSVRRVLLYVVLATAAVLFLLPLESAAMTSFKTVSGFAETLPFAPPPPDAATLAGWSQSWNALRATMLNSAMFVVPATLILPVLGSLAAFGLTITDWRGQLPVYILFMIGIFIPLQAVLVPLSITWQIVDVTTLLANLGPVNLWALPLAKEHHAQFVELAITHISFGIPLSTLLFRSHYKDLSDEMLEAARMDGVGMLTIYYRIVLPLSKPVFVVVMILAFTTIWNDLLFALVIVSSPAAEPVTVAFASLAGGMVQQFNVTMAAGFITALPTLLVYIMFTRQFAEGFSQTGV
jgi:glucose/mannose transport system permease protein